MKYGVDCLYPPSIVQAESLLRGEWSWLAVYVGGPRAAAHNAWHQVDGLRYPVRDLAGYFEGFLPVYVGRNAPWDSPRAFNFDQGVADGDDANVNTGACGFDSGTPLALDLEYGSFQANPVGTHEYVRGWVQQVNGAGHPAGVYSDLDTLNHMQLGELVDFKWGAAWIRNAFTGHAPKGRFDPMTPPPWQVWQFATGTVGGLSVDANSMTDDFKLASYG